MLFKSLLVTNEVSHGLPVYMRHKYVALLAATATNRNMEFRKKFLQCLVFIWMSFNFSPICATAFAQDAVSSENQFQIRSKLQFRLPTEATGKLRWCGDSGKMLIEFGDQNTLAFMVNDGKLKLRKLLTDAKPDSKSFTCTPDGVFAFFLNQAHTKLYVANMVSWTVDVLFEAQNELANAFIASIVSPRGNYVLGTAEFPDTLPLPNGQTMRVIKGLIPPGRKERATSIAWSNDERELFVLFAKERRLVVYTSDKTKLFEGSMPIADETQVVQQVVQDPLNSEDVYVLSVGDASSRIDLLSLREPKSSPKFEISEIGSSSIQVASDNTIAFSRGLFHGEQRRLQDDVFIAPYAVEINVMRNGVETKLATLSPADMNATPVISNSGKNVAFVKFSNPNQPLLSSGPQELVVILGQ